MNDPDEVVQNGLRMGDAISVSGDRLISGGLQAHVFMFDGTGWVHEEKLESFPASRAYGSAVAFDGDTALIGDFGWAESGDQASVTGVGDGCRQDSRGGSYYHSGKRGGLRKKSQGDTYSRQSSLIYR